MMTSHEGLVDQYCSVLRSYLANFEEKDLQGGYELGRLALAKGLGLLEMASVHHTALTFSLMDVSEIRERTRIIRGAERFFIETMTPFEMSLRGFQEVNA